MGKTAKEARDERFVLAVRVWQQGSIVKHPVHLYPQTEELLPRNFLMIGRSTERIGCIFLQRNRRLLQPQGRRPSVSESRLRKTCERNPDGFLWKKR